MVIPRILILCSRV